MIYKMKLSYYAMASLSLWNSEIDGAFIATKRYI